MLPEEDDDDEGALAAAAAGRPESVEGTGQVGTYLYTAPEIEQGWPKIDEKVRARHLPPLWLPTLAALAATSAEKHASLPGGGEEAGLSALPALVAI